MSLLEIREADAPPAIAAIYAEIKAASGLPLVNLIWRHFAALPGVLPWAWGAVQPLVTSASMGQARQRIVAGIALPAPAAVAAADWQDAASDQGGVARIGAILDAYTRGNLTNLVALTALRLRLEQPQAPPGRLLPAIAPPDAPPALDPLPQLADLLPEIAAQVRALAARHGGTGEVIPSLYLHLAHWPRLLEVLPRWLSALYAPAVLEVVRDATRRLAEAEAGTLLPVPTPPPLGAEATLNDALRHFTRQVIPDLIPVCLALNRLRPPN